jgi:hypothetical protein
MPESLPLLQEIAKIRERQDEQAEILNALLRHEGSDLKAKILAELQADSTMRDIYLLVDGRLSQQQILVRLQAAGSPNANKAGVSRRIDRLANDLGLITFVNRTSDGRIYRRSSLDTVLGISRSLDRR